MRCPAMNSTSPPSPRTCESWPSSSPDHSRPPQTEEKTGRALTHFGIGAHPPAAIRELFNTIHPTQPVAVRTPDDSIGGARGWRGAEPERRVSDRSADLCCGIWGRRPSAVTGRLSNERRPTEPTRPRYRRSPSRSARSYLPAPPSPASTNGAQTVDGRTRVGFSDRASPSQLGAVPRPGRLSGRSSVRRRRRLSI